MKAAIIIVLVLFCFFDGKCQTCPENTKFKETIHAVTYSGGKIVQDVTSINCFDSSMSPLALKNKFPDKKEWQIIHYSPQMMIQAIIDNNDTLEKVIYHSDSLGRRISNIQIYKKDTLTYQKWFYNKKGNDSIILTRQESELAKLNRIYKENFPLDGPRFDWKVGHRYFYDEQDRMIKEISYDFMGDSTVSRDEFKDNIESHFEMSEGKEALMYKIHKLSDKKIKTVYYEESGGYNYGLTMFAEKGGFKLEDLDEKGRLKKIETYSSKGTLINLIRFTYESF